MFDYLKEVVRLLKGAQPSLWVSPWIQIDYGATSGALDANDAFGNPFTFSVDVLGNPLPILGQILELDVLDIDDDTLAITVHVLTDFFTAAASDAAFTLGLADAELYVTSQTFAAGLDVGSFKHHEILEINKRYYSPKHTLVCQASTTGVPNIASAGTMPKVRAVVLPLAWG